MVLGLGFRGKGFGVQGKRFLKIAGACMDSRDMYKGISRVLIRDCIEIVVEKYILTGD